MLCLLNIILNYQRILQSSFYETQIENINKILEYPFHVTISEDILNILRSPVLIEFYLYISLHRQLKRKRGRLVK